MPPADALLETARLRLRPYGEGDLDALHDLWIDERVRRYLWDDVVIPRDLAESTMRDAIESFDARGIGQWVVMRRDDEKIIGFCGFRTIGDSPEIELLYGLLPPYWGQGLAVEAAQAVLRYGFERQGFPHVWARTDPPNAASIRVMQRLAMTPIESLWGEAMVCYRISRDEFPSGDVGHRDEGHLHRR